MTKLRQTFADARAYAASRKADPNYPLDARWEALQPVLAGKLPVVVHADELDCHSGRGRLRRPGKGEGDPARRLRRAPLRIAAEEARHPGHRRRRLSPAAPPRRRLRRSLFSPARLHEAGIKFCISSAGRFGASNVRNLPYHAATAAAYGLPPTKPSSITLSPAEILGVADRVGSLAAGKDATLFVTTGDPLETPTQVTAALIHGRPVDLNDRHKRLWKNTRRSTSGKRRKGVITATCPRTPHDIEFRWQ